jgi:hypothetical protein
MTWHISIGSPFKRLSRLAVSIEELHARLNHMPHSAIRHLIQSPALLLASRIASPEPPPTTSVKTASTESSPGHPIQSLPPAPSVRSSAFSQMCMAQYRSVADRDITIGLPSSMTIRDSRLSTSLPGNRTSTALSGNTRHGLRTSLGSESASYGMTRVASIWQVISTISWQRPGSVGSTPSAIRPSRSELPNE